MKRTLFTLCIALLFSAPASARFDTTNVLYDFENLVNGNLAGQDFWNTAKYNTAVDFRVADTISSHPSKVIFFNQSGPSVGADASRSFNLSFPGFQFDSQPAVYILEYDIKQNYWGITIGLAADLNNDGQTLMANANEKAFMLTTGTLNGEIIGLPNGTTTNLGNTFGNTWQRVQILINPFNGLSGTFTIGRKALSAQFYTNLGFNLPLYVDTLTTTKSNITRWNTFFIHSEGATGMVDNIRLSKITPSVTSLEENTGAAYAGWYHERMLYIRGIKAIANCRVVLVDASGRIAAELRTEGDTELPLTDLKSGWYCARIQGTEGLLQVPFFVH